MPRLAAIVGVAWALPGLAVAASWQGLVPPAPFDQTYGTAISADGSVVVGYARNSGNGVTQAFRWTTPGGLVLLGTTSTGGTTFSSTSACCVSADGSIVAGSGTTAAAGSNATPLQWTISASGSNILTAVASPYANTQVRALSGDGTLIGGTGMGPAAAGFCVASSSLPALWPSAGARWDSAGLPPGTNAGDVHGVGFNSYSGTVVVGDVYDICPGANTGPQAFVWTASTGYMLLGTFSLVPSSPATLSIATAISSDGNVVTGYSGNPANPQPFIWNTAAHMIMLGSPGASNGSEVGFIPTGVSDAEGSAYIEIVVGNNSTPTNPRAPDSPAELWTFSTGAVNLFDVLLENGMATPPEFFALSNVAGISADSNWVVGTAASLGPGFAPVAFVSYLGLSPPAPANLQVIASAAGTVTLSWQPVAGATDYLVNLNGNLWLRTTNTTATLSGLTAGGSYNVSVGVESPQGQSAPSNAVSIAVTPGDGQLAVTWAPVTGAASYVIGISTYPGGESASTSACSSMCGAAVPASATTGAVTGLQNGVTYYVKVFAEAALGSPVSSTESSAAPAAAAPISTASSAAAASNSGGASGGGGELELLSLVTLGSMVWLRLRSARRRTPQPLRC